MKTCQRTFAGNSRQFGADCAAAARVPGSDLCQPAPLVPRELLGRTRRILFITHLALGDFAYLQNFFRAFAQAHPHLEVHLWIDEVRRTSDESQWQNLRNYSLYDWVNACPFFQRVYTRTYSPALYRESIREAQDQHYELVVSLATLRPHRYVALAREISPRGFIAGMAPNPGLSSLVRFSLWRKLDARIFPYKVDRKHPQHISAIYADWFSRLFGLVLEPDARFPFVQIPAAWQADARRQVQSWACQGHQRVFINPVAKTKKRSWPLARVAELIAALASRREWKNACFIVNAMPHELGDVRNMIASKRLERTHAFSASENFFQLPAMLSMCDLIISVETSIMHLANAVQVPVIALVRQKNPEWMPIDKAGSTVITTPHRRDRVEAITVAQVLDALPQDIEPLAAVDKSCAEARQDNTFHIAFCVDNNYFRSMGATIASIVANNPGTQFTFHVLAFEVAGRHRASLLELARRFNVRTQLHIIEPATFSELRHFIAHSYYSLAIFSRLLVPAVLTGVASRVLYLDADILCVGRLDELIAMDIRDDIAAVVADAPLTAARRSRALGIRHGRYFNGGVMLINIDRWIASQVTRQAMHILVHDQKALRFNDQDALNIVLDGRLRYLDGKYNRIYDMVRELDQDVRAMHAPGDAVLLHFAGAVKPWAQWTGHEACALFRHYHAMSPWADMALDPAPRHPREMRLQSRFLKNRGQILQALAWYGRYLRARFG